MLRERSEGPACPGAGKIALTRGRIGGSAARPVGGFCGRASGLDVARREAHPHGRVLTEVGRSRGRFDRIAKPSRLRPSMTDMAGFGLQRIVICRRCRPNRPVTSSAWSVYGTSATSANTRVGMKRHAQGGPCGSCACPADFRGELEPPRLRDPTLLASAAIATAARPASDPR